MLGAPTFDKLSIKPHKLLNRVDFYDEVIGICNASLNGEGTFKFHKHVQHMEQENELICTKF